MLTLSTLTCEYVRVQVSALVNGVHIDPTGDTVQMAFVAVGTDPGSGDWRNGSWDTTAVNGTYLAECLIGPGSSAVLAVGSYDVWIKVTDSPEQPVRKVGQLKVV